MAKELVVCVGDYGQALNYRNNRQHMTVITQNIQTEQQMMDAGLSAATTIKNAPMDEEIVFTNCIGFINGVRSAVLDQKIQHKQVVFLVFDPNKPEPTVLGLDEFGKPSPTWPEGLFNTSYALAIRTLEVQYKRNESDNIVAKE